ncbi:MAG: tRNA 2-thiocytidine biosynthesis protein TtcA [Syntrophomonadaceae bacterium]|nr:tRNA 2-thiocytidine biosynthesis protein TtcA [Syntrophomonadaceae bacterium]
MISKSLFRRLKAANLKYGMVQTGDRIAVGVSGGKDSLVLLHALRSLKDYTPLEFDLFPVTIDMGWGDDWSPITEHCAALGLPHHIVKTQIGPLVFEERKESNPCALCSNLRSGSLSRAAIQLGCNKVALGHHLDDAVVTLLMSMMFEGRYRTFRPVTYLSRMHLFLIRPLIYVEEKLLVQSAKVLCLPVQSSRCPVAGATNREKIKSFLNMLESHYPSSKRRMLKAMENVDANSFWD